MISKNKNQSENSPRQERQATGLNVKDEKGQKPGIWSLEVAMGIALIFASIPLVNIVALPIIFFVVGLGFLFVLFGRGIRRRLHGLSKRTVDNPKPNYASVWMKGLQFPPEGRSQRWTQDNPKETRAPARTTSGPMRSHPRRPQHHKSPTPTHGR